ncbi:hypothetical protein [Brevundimonas bacteroides]|uniref:hypothetical protein n=1 Tax=Brevundimonas bacteroides TaxID=74311 RepID=UPI0004983254|nr:hypothetical protein [Brevundimonas bacteroides]
MNRADPTEKPPRSRLLLIGLIVGTIVAFLAILPAFVMATMSVMVAASGSDPLIFNFLIFAWGLPVVVVLGPVGAWIAYALRRERTAWVLLLLPATWAACMFALLAVAPGGSG